MKIPFSPPDVTALEAQAVHDVITSGWITTGPKTKELERQVATFCRTERAACLSSATAAMESTLRLLGIGSGDEVITSAYTYTASASPVCHVGARLVFCDVSKDSIEMDYDRLSDSINEHTKVIVPVDLGGMVCDYDRIRDIVDSKRHLFRPQNDLQRAIGHVVVMDDAAHAFGSERQGHMTGDIADFTAFSFHAVKNLTTAEGGAVTWRPVSGVDNEEIYRQYQLLSLHGQNKDALAKTQLGAWEYDIAGPWYKCNMTDIMAAIGLVQLQRYPDMLKRRRQIIERYDEAFRELGLWSLSHFRPGHVSNGHLYMTRIPGLSERQRNDVIVSMAEKGVTCNVHFKPLPMMTGYRALGFDIKDFPNAYDVYKNEVTLPLYSRLTDEQVEYIISSYRKTLG